MKANSDERARPGAVYLRVSTEGGSLRAGEVPPTEAWPELWVVDPSNVEEAKRLVNQALEPAGPAQPGWTCPNCKEVNEGQFGKCWNCGANCPKGSDA